MSKIEEIKNLFEQFDFEIKDELDNDEYYRIKINDCFLFFDKIDDEIHLTFKASCRPDYSSYITSLISNNIKINKIYPTEVYYDIIDDTYFGDEAYKIYYKEIFNDLLNSYQQQIDEMEYLQNAEPNTIN